MPSEREWERESARKRMQRKNYFKRMEQKGRHVATYTHPTGDLFAWIDELSAYSPLDYIKRIIHIYLHKRPVKVRCCCWCFFSFTLKFQCLHNAVDLVHTYTLRIFYGLNESILQCIGTHSHNTYPNKQYTKFFRILPTHHHHLFIIGFFFSAVSFPRAKKTLQYLHFIISIDWIQLPEY